MELSRFEKLDNNNHYERYYHHQKKTKDKKNKKKKQTHPLPSLFVETNHAMADA